MSEKPRAVVNNKRKVLSGSVRRSRSNKERQVEEENDTGGPSPFKKLKERVEEVINNR